MTLIDKLKKTFWTTALFTGLTLSTLGLGGCASNPVKHRLPPKQIVQKHNPIKKYALLVSALSENNSKYALNKYDYDSQALFRIYAHLINSGFLDKNIFVLYSDGKKTPNFDVGDKTIAERIKKQQFNEEYDNTASRFNIKNIINGLKERLDENDKFIFHILAHGGKNGNIYLEKGKSIIPYDFQKLVNGWKSKSNWFLIDCCYGGKLVDLIKTNNVCLVSDTQSDTKGIINDYWMGCERFLRYKCDIKNDLNKDGIVDCNESIRRWSTEAQRYWPSLKNSLTYWHKKEASRSSPNEISIIPKSKAGRKFKIANLN